MKRIGTLYGVFKNRKKKEREKEKAIDKKTSETKTNGEDMKYFTIRQI
jgi:hypothetical protein